MSKFVELPDTSGKPILVNIDKIMFVEKYTNYLVLVFGKSDEGRLTKNVKISMERFLELTSDKA